MVAVALADGVEEWFEQRLVAIARTRPAWGEQAAVREIETLYLRAIGARAAVHLCREPVPHGAADRNALAARLTERDGPEVVIVGPKQCEGFIETAVMDRGRSLCLDRLRAADAFGRLRVLHPVSTADDGQPTPSICTASS